MDHIYLDNAATTPMSDEVVATMMDQMQHDFGNASSVHAFGRKARAVLDDSRHVIANSIHAKDDEIVFTAGGTESNNTVWMQTATVRRDLGRRIITTAIEHESIMKTANWLAHNGYDVVYLPVNEEGSINLDDLKAALTDDTILVSIMTGNNEVGSTMPIHEIGELLQDHQAWFHTDAVQAYGLLDIDVNRDHIDLLSTSAHKINGPKQMGFLFRREGIDFPSFMKGGDQEDKRRAGTENIPAIAGFATAVTALTADEKAHRQAKYASFKQYVVDGLTKAGVDFEINGSLRPDNLQHVLNLWIKGVENDVTLTNLDLAGVAVSAGSACTAGSLDPSHVLVAMFGKDNPRVMQSIRLSFGRYTTTADLDSFINALTAMTQRLNASANEQEAN
ncbi:cysteine desulfurase family protein [Furfurilactobacillus siliginis]|uniref:Cysteine desulfurase n=1 Tax=Furfurilactobacillus siliginis TaxID=348151 RepID=A0A0R2L2V6_9LACO|nr:cysteine desulfurase family protein [Furfurilactobacillus siliginis]KRN96136.1 cysteine desulfurase [Furfurilactobacillus siliginis]GEK27940.1 cysteine desulfurase [Furfurilactobacillus siliginis]